jgi:predicted MPP superfamily phosphohydrolase
MEGFRMPTEVQTLILRFRDLATAVGETLALHRQIAQKDGYVWWGWWNKFGEQAPADVFTELNARMHPAGLDLYLFDSGKNELHQARATEIQWGAAGARIPSPEVDRTPKYYKEQNYFAWFKFTDIATMRTDTAILRTFTYVQVPDFFESRVSRFLPFYGKRVESPEELQEQNRTIWFVRPYQVGDRTGAVSLPPRPTASTPFSTDPLASHSSTLLWLSDVHFGNHAFPLASDHFGKDLSQALESDLKQKGQNSVAAAIISGDLTWKDEAAEFEQAKRFVGGLHSWSTLDPSRILISPGNHDVKFSGDPSKIGDPVTLAANDAKRCYSDFYRGLYAHAPNEFLSCGRRFLVGNAVAVDVVCLNSSLLEQTKDAFQGQGFVGDDQLIDAATQMGWDRTSASDAPRGFRILVLHHHLVPVTFRPVPHIGYRGSITWDAEAVTRWIVKNQVDLVLHGHMHDPFFAWIGRPNPDHSEKWHTFHIAGLGSSGVKMEELGDEKYNTYGLIEFSRREVAVEVRRINSQGSIPSSQVIVWHHSFAYTNSS